jgi:hypothetical protein
MKVQFVSGTLAVLALSTFSAPASASSSGMASSSALPLDPQRPLRGPRAMPLRAAIRRWRPCIRNRGIIAAGGALLTYHGVESHTITGAVEAVGGVGLAVLALDSIKTILWNATHGADNWAVFTAPAERRSLTSRLIFGRNMPFVWGK